MVGHGGADGVEHARAQKAGKGKVGWFGPEQVHGELGHAHRPEKDNDTRTIPHAVQVSCHDIREFPTCVVMFACYSMARPGWPCQKMYRADM